MKAKYFESDILANASRVLVGNILIALIISCALGADSDTEEKKWSFNSSLSRTQLAEMSEIQQKEGNRIADLETFKIGRKESVAAIWVESKKDEKWAYKEGMSFSSFKKEHELHTSEGYYINEIESIRIGANLEFSGVWSKSPEQEPTVLYWGMDDMLFSNRYGEMADRGYRLVDFEVYESNGNSIHTAIWKECDPETSVRFYRALDEMTFASVSNSLEEEGYRLVDIEGYEIEGKLVFAGSWEKLQKGEEAKREYNLSVDVFYQKNAEYMAEGYRMVDFDTYAKSVSELRYAGCWVRQVEVEEEEDKDAFLDSFRISSK